MPCTGGPSYDEEKVERERRNVEKAMLCAALSYIDKNLNKFDDFVKSTDWEEHGVTSKSIRDWWINHQKQDELRKKQEQLAREKEEIIKNALSKLTEKEKKALKLK